MRPQLLMYWIFGFEKKVILGLFWLIERVLRGVRHSYLDPNRIVFLMEISLLAMGNLSVSWKIEV